MTATVEMPPAPRPAAVEMPPAPRPATAGTQPAPKTATGGMPPAPGPATVPTGRTGAPRAPLVAEAGRRGRARPLRAVLAVAVLAMLAAEAIRTAPGWAQAVAALGTADAGWLGCAVLATAGSMAAFARLRLRLLRSAGVPVAARGSVAAAYAANALHVTLPGGAAFSTAYSYRWLLATGAGGAVATWTLAAGGLVSTVTLLGLGMLGSLLAGTGAGPARVVEIIAVLGVVALVRLAARRPEPLLQAVRWLSRRIDRLAGRPPGTAAHRVDALVRELRQVRPGRRDWAAAAGYALVNWVLDAASLAASAHALGAASLPVPALLLTFTAGMAAGGLSLVPAGLGIVDATMVLTLVSCGVPAAAALPIVVLYRLISVAGVVAVGWLLLVLRLVPPPSRAPAGGAAAAPGGRSASRPTGRGQPGRPVQIGRPARTTRELPAGAARRGLLCRPLTWTEPSAHPAVLASEP